MQTNSLQDAKSIQHGCTITQSVIKDWNFNIPDRLYESHWLLTIGGVATVGMWTGELGEHFTAWAEL